jgi:hypothetical protein
MDEEVKLMDRAECHRILKPNGTVALSVWFKEAWIAYVCNALAHLPGLPYGLSMSEELTSTWAQGPWESPHYVEGMLHVMASQI